VHSKQSERRKKTAKFTGNSNCFGDIRVQCHNEMQSEPSFYLIPVSGNRVRRVWPIHVAV